MPRMAAFYSVNEVKKPAENRVHHNNSACPAGRDIPVDERRPGTGGYRLCEVCGDLNQKGLLVRSWPPRQQGARSGCNE
jgi:hypothetical protein